ncbi:MAG: aminotransferase class I/II-fold pyridoxal phosphate-dependent enzyme [bacterium]|nr:aminotransferase class I/II-fold pyridoxal phosphate-dependent enzyme [bacterium]
MGGAVALEAYPYDRLVRLRAVANQHAGGCADLSLGDPCDPPPPAAVAALGGSGAEAAYPRSVGTPAFRAAAADWLARRCGAEVATDDVAACVGTKELVATLPRLLQLQGQEGDTVLFPAVAYPTYAMGAALAGLRALAVPLAADGRLDLAAINPSDADRAICLWVNSPANPTGALADLGAVAAWGRQRGVVVCSDECYVEFVWDRPPQAPWARIV